MPTRASRTPSARCSAPSGSAAPCTSCATCWGTCRERTSRWCAAPSRVSPPDRASAGETLAAVVAQLEPAAGKVERLLEAAEEELLAYMRFPREHWPKIRSTNPLERVDLEIARRSDVVGIYPNDAALLRLATSLSVEQNDEWLIQKRYLSLHSLAALTAPTRALRARRGRPASAR